MTPRPLILDLFSGAGGAAAGYQRAGFDVVGVDHEPQPRYPFPFLQADALGVLADLAAGRAVGPFAPGGSRLQREDFAAVHASPPCLRFTAAQSIQGNDHPDLLTPTRALLQAAGLPYVIENVQRAPMSPFSALLCGLSFGLKVFRHRLFESSFLLLAPAHVRHGGRRIGKDGMCCVAGTGDQSRRRKVGPVGYDHRSVAAWKTAMGIDWMSQRELAQAVPPAYTHYLGAQLLRALKKGVSGD